MKGQTRVFSTLLLGVQPVGLLLWEEHPDRFGDTMSMIIPCSCRDSWKGYIPLRRLMRGMAPPPTWCWKIEEDRSGWGRFQIDEPELELPMALACWMVNSLGQEVPVALKKSDRLHGTYMLHNWREMAKLIVRSSRLQHIVQKNPQTIPKSPNISESAILEFSGDLAHWPMRHIIILKSQGRILFSPGWIICSTFGNIV